MDHVPATWGPWTRCAICGIAHLDSPLNEDRHCAPCVKACTNATRDEMGLYRYKFTERTSEDPEPREGEGWIYLRGGNKP